MKPKLLLRITSALLLIFFCGHTYRHLTRKNITDPKGREVLQSMEEYHFNFMGAVQTYDGLMEGYGLMASFILAALCLLLWIMSGETEKEPAFCRRLLVPVLLFTAGNAYVAYRYFFTGPAIFSLLASLLLILAIMRLRQPAAGS